MKIDRIKFSAEVSAYGSHYWIGAEASVDENENPQEALQSLKAFVVADFTEIESMRGTTVKDIIPLPDELETALTGINNAKTVDELKTFWILSKSNLNLVDAYNKKLNSFTNAK